MRLEAVQDWLLDEANHILVALLTILVTLLIIRVTSCLPAYASSRKRLPRGRGRSGEKLVKTMVYFGSGGHTTEMIRLVQGLDVHKYQPLIFAIGHTDVTSQKQVRAANLAIEPAARWLRVYRNREVKQSWFTTVFTTLWSLVQSLYVMYRNRPQLLLVNGPGTTVSLCYCAFLLRVLGLADTTIVFVESFCRTREPSLTARLVYPVADRFVVPWPDLLDKFPRSDYLGNIM
jgi:beta-1,4-N-acetylglucosaminyltransferase